MEKLTRKRRECIFEIFSVAFKFFDKEKTGCLRHEQVGEFMIYLRRLFKEILDKNLTMSHASFIVREVTRKGEKVMYSALLDTCAPVLQSYF